MKKLILIVLCFGLMALGSAGSAGAYSLTQNQTGTFQFNLPTNLFADFSALLGISAITRGGDVVNIEEQFIGVLNQNNGNKLHTTYFDVTENIMNYYEGNGTGPLDVTITAIESLTLGTATLTLALEPAYVSPTNENNTAPVPEPATLLLLGSGLSGLALWGKRRRVEV